MSRPFAKAATKPGCYLKIYLFIFYIFLESTVGLCRVGVEPQEGLIGVPQGSVFYAAFNEQNTKLI